MSLFSSHYSCFLVCSNSLSLTPEQCLKGFILLFEQFVALLLFCLFGDGDDEYEKPFSLPQIHMLAIQNHKCCTKCCSFSCMDLMCYVTWNPFSFLCNYGYTQRNNIMTKQFICFSRRSWPVRSWPVYLSFWFSAQTLNCLCLIYSLNSFLGGHPLVQVMERRIR